MEDDDLAPSQFKVEVDTAEETESVEECRTIIPGRRFQYLDWVIWSSGSNALSFYKSQNVLGQTKS